jgi:HEAT repeat protein
MLLVPALATVEAPTAAAEQTLRDLARTGADEQIRSTAQLGLGIVARSLMADEPARARRILQDTLQDLEAATTPEARRQLLLVLGNIGADDTLAVITRHLRDEAAPVRAAAAAALRWLESPAVEDLLVKALMTDADDAVRLEAAQALAFRPMTDALLAAHRPALTGDASAAVRLALLRNVAQASRTSGAARALLAETAHSDPVAEVREEAERLLAESAGAAR